MDGYGFDSTGLTPIIAISLKHFESTNFQFHNQKSQIQAVYARLSLDPEAVDVDDEELRNCTMDIIWTSMDKG